jgi:hypothetical protein
MTDQELFHKLQTLLDDYYGDLPVNETTGAVVLSETVAQHIIHLFDERKDAS